MWGSSYTKLFIRDIKFHCLWQTRPLLKCLEVPSCWCSDLAIHNRFVKTVFTKFCKNFAKLTGKLLTQLFFCEFYQKRFFWLTDLLQNNSSWLLLGVRESDEQSHSVIDFILLDEYRHSDFDVKMSNENLAASFDVRASSLATCAPKPKVPGSSLAASRFLGNS